MSHCKSIGHFRSLFYKKPLPPSKSEPSYLPLSRTLEEENVPDYDPEHFYPARIGQVLNGRYQLSTKLGYGLAATVWLAQDLHQLRWEQRKYVALKISSTGSTSLSNRGNNELTALEHIATANVHHVGWSSIRQLSDSFSIDGKKGKHVCLVFEPLRETWPIYRDRYVGKVIPLGRLQKMVRGILEGLDYLHSECHLVHTDMKPNNVMVTMEDHSILHRDACDEYNSPLPQKSSKSRTIYQSRNDYGPIVETGSALTAKIIDFNFSITRDEPHVNMSGGGSYRAPEMTLNTGFSYSADIWSLGVMLWDLLEGEELFSDAIIQDSKFRDIDLNKHLAMITKLLGPIPVKLVHGERAAEFYHLGTSEFKLPRSVDAEFSFENSIRRIDGEVKAVFLNFVKRMIIWDPEERSSAKELLRDPWIHMQFPGDGDKIVNAAIRSGAKNSGS